MQEQLARIEKKIDVLLSLKTIIEQLTEAKQLERRKERERKAVLREAARALENKSSIPLPDKVFRPDKRIFGHFQKWALKGMEYGKANRPEEFATWVCWQWNCATYSRKPITFSGGYFQYHIGSGRMHTTPFELMGLSKKTKLLIRNDAEHVDFKNRLWWDWSFSVFFRVFRAMSELDGFGELPERFVKCCKILCGGYGMYEVFTDLYFDPNESQSDVNRMLRRVGPDLMNMWRACCKGLRKKRDGAMSQDKAWGLKDPVTASRKPP